MLTESDLKPTCAPAESYAKRYEPYPDKQVGQGLNNDQQQGWNAAITEMLRLINERFTHSVTLDSATAGIVELACINPNVDSYMKHWEGRALKAEEELKNLRAKLAEREAEDRKIYDLNRRVDKLAEQYKKVTEQLKPSIDMKLPDPEQLGTCDTSLEGRRVLHAKTSECKNWRPA